MVTSNQCGLCEYYTGRHKCVAYPEEIPDKFLLGDELHDVVEEDQYGQITFEAIDDSLITFSVKSFKKISHKSLAEKVFKDLAGRGNWGHTGLTGQHGGSSPTGGVSETFLEHPAELRHSFDIDTGEFDEKRHQKYLDTLDEQEASEYIEEMEEEIEAEELPEVELEPDPGVEDVVAEDGEIDYETLEEVTKDMEFEEAYEVKMEVAGRSAEARFEKYSQEQEEFAQETGGAEVTYEVGEESVEVEFEEKGWHGDYETRKAELPLETLDVIEEFNELETLDQQRDYIDNEVKPMLASDDVDEVLAGSRLDQFFELQLQEEERKEGDFSVEEKQNAILGIEESPMEIDLNFVDDDMTPETQERISEAKEFYETFGHKTDFTFEEMEVYQRESGMDPSSLTGIDPPTISLRAGDNDATIIHEMAHVIHRRSGEELEYAVNEFFEQRTEGVTPTNQYEGYEAEGYAEVFYDDYAGRVYTHEEEGKFGEEVLSTGMERMYTDPDDFREEDPEHFNLCYAALKGVF